MRNSGEIRRAAIAGLALCVAAAVTAQGPSQPDAAALRLAIEKLSVLGSVLYIGAHPDDENTALLAYLAKGRKMRTAYLSLTRGDGGQNLVGTEQGEALGVLRTEELLAARRIDGAHQFFTRAVDFGYSKGPAETFRIWGHDAVLADVVWIIRWFRPDVIITRFPTDGEGGHGHHTASAILAGEAFTAAADPTMFPDQLRWVRPWQATRLLWNAWRRPGQAGSPPDGSLLSVDLGAYDPLLGRSYAELAAIARSMHKSQGFGSSPRRGTLPNLFAPVAGETAKSDLFDGIDTSWRRVPGGETVGAALARARASYRDDDPAAAVPDLLAALDLIDRLPADPWVTVKRQALVEVIADCAGLWLDLGAAAPEVTPGGTMPLTITAINRSALPLRLTRVELPYGATVALADAALPDNQPVTAQTTITMPTDAPLSQPYWLAGTRSEGVYTEPPQPEVGAPRNPPAVSATFVLRLGTHDLTYTVPAVYRSTDPVEGERVQELAVVPPVTVNLESPVLLFPDVSPRPVRAVARRHRDGAGAVISLALPMGWTADPGAISLEPGQAGEESQLRWTLTPTNGAASGALRVLLDGDRPTPARGVIAVDHPYIPPRLLLPPAVATLVRVDVRRPVRRVGYVMGPGDEIPAVLRQLGFDVTLLSDDVLENGDLSGFDAIVTGIRAYNTRPRLATAEDRLLAYVAAGGTLVVQYNTSRETVTDRLGPWPIHLSHDRVTDENAPVTFADPTCLVLTEPNAITAADFDGWVQERGLYFPDSWDPRYQAPLAMADPGEKATRGALLAATYGKGHFLYTGLAFFRQLPAGNPGAIRLFVNLLAAGRPGA
ncbi:MAG: PIG-L family deacetylase [Acidobacteriota bacterium]